MLSKFGSVLVSNSGYSILSSLSIAHPVASVIIKSLREVHMGLERIRRREEQEERREERR